MVTTLGGDYSKYPAAITGAFARVAGETCAMRESWLIYNRLFMQDEDFTEHMSEQLGPLLGVLQTLLEDSMFLSIARLTDKDSRQQPNLSVWTLRDAIPFAKSPDFATKVEGALNAIQDAAADIRAHRHKRIAHFDRDVGLEVKSLPVVQFSALKNVLEMIEKYLNLFFWEFERTTMSFDMIVTDNITGKAEVTAIKAQVYDLLEQNGTIPRSEWRRHWRDRKRKDTSSS
jgi:hypothetical protein